MRKFLLLNMAVILGAFALSSCSQDEDMQSVNIAAGLEQFQKAFDGYKAAVHVDMSSLDQAIQDIYEFEDSLFSPSETKGFLLGLLGSAADILEGEHSYAYSWAAPDSLISMTASLWNLFSTDSGILSLLQNNSYSATFYADAETCYTVEMATRINNNIGSGSLETGLKRETVVKINDFQLIRVVLENSLDVRYSLLQPSLTPGAATGIVIEYGGLLIESRNTLASTKSGNFVTHMSRDGQEIANVVCDLTRSGAVIAADACIGLKEETSIGVQIYDMLQFARDNATYSEYWQLQGVSFDECSELADSWNSNVVITVEMSGSPFLDMHMGCVAVEDTAGLYLPDAVFTLSDSPDEELSYDELSESLGIDLFQLIRDLLLGGGGGGGGQDYPEIIL